MPRPLTLALVLLNAALLWVLAERLASDEAQRLEAGREIAAEALAWDARWRAQPPLSDRGLLDHPPPDPDAAALAFTLAAGDDDALAALDAMVEDNPLAALRWRARDGGAEAPHPWADAVIWGALAQGPLHAPGRPRLVPSHVGGLDPARRDALLSWCLEDAERLALPVCHRDSAVPTPDVPALLADPLSPPQGVVLLAAFTLSREALEGIVDDGAQTPRARRLALMAYARKGSGVEARLVGWLAEDDPPFLKVLAALELLRLGARDAAPTIRAAATPVGTVEALTMGWAADLLTDEARYR